MKPTDFIKEEHNLVQAATEMHTDHEIQMAREACYRSASNAIELHRMLKHISEQEGLQAWASEKISLANDYLRAVKEWLEYELMSRLEGRVAENNMDIVEGTKETSTGRVHKSEPGGYGRRDDEDEDKKKAKPAEPAVKRGRGRPKKDADSDTGEVKKWDTAALSGVFGGSVPKKLPGKASVKHKIKDEPDEKLDENDSQAQLRRDFDDVIQKVKREWEAKRARERQGMSPRTVSEPSREELEARLRELESEFDPEYQYSDDYSFWTKQNAIAREIASIKKKLGSQGVAEGGAETSWSDGDEKITLQDVLELTKHIKQINLPINDNLKSKLIHWDGNPEEIERINQVTVSNQFPILVMLDGQGQISWILDGNHRLHKAIRSQAKTIPAKLIKPSDLSDKAKRIFHIKEQGVAEGSDLNTQSHLDTFKSETDTMKPGTTKYVGRKDGKEVYAKKDAKGNVKFYHRDGIKGPLKGVAEGFKNTYSIGDRVDGPMGTGTIVAVSKNVNVDGRVKVKLDDPSKAGEDGKYKDSFVLTTTQLKHISEQGVAEGQGSIVDKCASLAAKYFNSAGLQQQYDIDEFIKINTGDNVVVDKCASLAAKYFNSAGLQQQYDIGEYIKANVRQGVAEGLSKQFEIIYLDQSGERKRKIVSGTSKEAVARQFKKQYKLEIEQVKQLQQGVAEGFQYDVDHMPGPRKSLADVNKTSKYVVATNAIGGTKEHRVTVNATSKNNAMNLALDQFEKKGLKPRIDFDGLRLISGVAEGTKETSTGRIHKSEPGGYGRRDDDDIKKKEKAAEPVKRGRGRPKKDADSETGEVKKWDTDTLQRWIVGSVPKKLPGKASVKHKIKDEPDDKMDESMRRKQTKEMASAGASSSGGFAVAPAAKKKIIKR